MQNALDPCRNQGRFGVGKDGLATNPYEQLNIDALREVGEGGGTTAAYKSP